MGYKKKNSLIGLVAVLGIVLGLVLALPENVGLCDPLDYTCIGSFIDSYDTIATILVLLLSPVLMVSLLLFFFSEQTFNSWIRFAKYYLPIAVALIFLSPAIDSSILGFDKEFMTWLLAGIFFITSFGIIIFKRSLGHLVSK